MSVVSKTRTMVLMLGAIFFCGMHWGFVSFSATTLHEQEGLSYSEIGSLLPVFALAMIVSSFAVGVVADKVPHRLLFPAGQAFIIGGIALIFFSSATFGVMVAGFAVIGIGYGPVRAIPYIQVRLFAGDNEKKYDNWFMAVSVAFILSFASGRGMMMLSTILIDEEPGDDGWSWRLPWVVAGLGEGLFFLLLVLFGDFHTLPRGSGDPAPKTQPVAAPKTDGEDTTVPVPAPTPAPTAVSAAADEFADYVKKLKTLYCSPVSVTMLAAYIFMVFGLAAISVWTPSIATARFEDVSESSLNLTVAIAVLTAMPVGLILTKVILAKAKRLDTAARIVFGASLLAFVFMLGLVFLQVFELFIVALVLYVGAVYTPHLFSNTLPTTLNVPAEHHSFVLSRLILAYTIFGDIAANFVGGFILEEWGEDRLLQVTVITCGISTLLWGIPMYWSFTPDSPVSDIVEEKDAQDSAGRRAKSWQVLRSFGKHTVTLKKAIQIMGMGVAPTKRGARWAAPLLKQDREQKAVQMTDGPFQLPPLSPQTVATTQQQQQPPPQPAAPMPAHAPVVYAADPAPPAPVPDTTSVV